MKEWIKKHHRAIVDPSELAEVCGNALDLLTPLADDADPSAVVEWLTDILGKVAASLREGDGHMIKNNIDVANIEVYLKSLSALLDITDEYHVMMKWPTFFTLLDRLIAGETVNFEGKPLVGLQIMGILETRALDFDYIIIPSLNERILPARNRARTFISESLRQGYGLPPISYSESLFAYYFYRMISRAKEVVLVYDSRTSDGARNGDVSRYVLQLQYLHARESIIRESRTFMLSKSVAEPSPIEKSEYVVDVLANFLSSGENARNLSATALTKYTACQLKFYFEEILRIRTDETSSEFIDPITHGKIFHDVMQRIYLPSDKQNKYLVEPEIIDAEKINSLIKDTERIDALIKNAINREHFHLAEEELNTPLHGSSVYVAIGIRNQILSTLRFDLKIAPFKLYGVEIDGDVKLSMPDGMNVNMRFAIDRLDEVIINSDGVASEIMRIVDYKTGAVHAEAETFESIFSGDYKAKNLLQLLLYANLFDALPDKTGVHSSKEKEGNRPLLTLFDSESTREPSQGYCLELYDVNKLDFKHRVFPKIEKTKYSDHSDLNSPFLSRLRDIIGEIFNPKIPFSPTSDRETCEICALKSVCFRE